MVCRSLEQSAFKCERSFALALCFDASLRSEVSPSNRKTLQESQSSGNPEMMGR